MNDSGLLPAARQASPFDGLNASEEPACCGVVQGTWYTGIQDGSIARRWLQLAGAGTEATMPQSLREEHYAVLFVRSSMRVPYTE